MCDLALNFEGQDTEADLNNADISEVCLRNNLLAGRNTLLRFAIFPT